MATSKTKPVSPLKRGFKTNAEKTSVSLRNALGLKDYAPLSALTLAEHLGVRILIPNDIPGITRDILDVLLTGKGKNQWSAAIYVRDDKKYVIHNPTHSIFRQESNLMHELAHAICEHELQDLETAILGSIIPLRKYHIEQEAEAECLGACLQLPQKALFHYHHILKKSAEEISLEFNASIQMVRFRLAVTGVPKIKFN